MIDLVKSHLTEIESICRHHHVLRLELFGSAALEGPENPPRDLDFLVEFSPEANAPWMGEYFELKRSLERLFQRPVDLVMSGHIENPFFQKGLSNTRTLVYG